MASISDITEDLINTAVGNDDLNEALFDFQKAIGVDSGDVAARVFAFGWDDEWPDATAVRRREMMDHYIELERLHARSDEDGGEDLVAEAITCSM